MTKRTIAVFFGGQSTEHDISIITAIGAVIKPLQASNNFTVIPIYIAKDGRWFSDDKLKDVAFYRSGAINEYCEKTKPIAISFDNGLIIKKPGLKSKDIRIDVAFPSMHGAYGEDGSLMGLLRMSGIPFVGLDMAASVISMDKILSKQIASLYDIPTSKFKSFYKTEFIDNKQSVIDSIVNYLKFPLFVKPPHLGSSIGITKVDNADELLNAIEVAVYYDNKVIVEEAVNNLIEVTVPIIGNQIMQPALVEKAILNDDTFFDFETKYIGNGKKSGAKKMSAQGYSELPAKLPDGLYDKSVDTAKRVYQAVGCEGIARIDLLIDSKSGIVYFNEINPMPGSLYNHNWRAAGVSPVELVTRLVELADERFKEAQKLQTTFESSFLKQF